MKCDILVIGGGAAGLAAAISAKRAGAANVVIAERGERVGRKLAATGNGRCNISNAYIDASRYHGHIGDVLYRVTPEMTRDFFDSIGVIYTEGEEGKLYPNSLQASSVVDALRFECERIGVTTLCGCEVTALKSGAAATSVGEIEFKKAIVACGGEASRKLGGTPLGYKLLRDVGHTACARGAAIVPVKTETEKIRALKGIKVDAVVTAESERGKRTEQGEVLFTEYGLSGPPILQVSRLFDGCGGTVKLDLMPQFDFRAVVDMLHRRKGRVYEDRCEHLFVGLLNKRVGQAAVKCAGKNMSDSAAALTDAEVKAIAAAVKGFLLTVKGNCGLDAAQVTTGGVPTDEFDLSRMCSRKSPTVYACGEVLDVDGDCGGFNLQWAWSSGILAGRSAAEDL